MKIYKTAALISLFVAFYNITSLEAQVRKFDLPIKIENSPYNFGTFPKDSVVTTTLSFVNISEQDIIVDHADVSCPCVTVLDFTKKPIKPGKKGKIFISVDNSNKSTGPFQQFVVIGINQEPKFIRFFVRGTTTDKKEEEPKD